jgi:hypothetical protein
MILFHTASSDASIYLQQPYQNTGIDEILEISKQYYGDTKDVSRVLIKFNSASVVSYIDDNNFTASLQLKITEANEIASNFTIELFEVSGSWENGTGTRFDNLTTNGASWYYRNENNANWYTTMNGITASYGIGVTGSWDGLGGSWFTQSIATQTFSYTLEDINLDITNAVRNWRSGSVHTGFILKLTSAAENDDSDYGSIKMFSKETNTIYQPKLVLAYPDSGSVTGSLSEVVDAGNAANYEFLYRVYPSNLKKEYTKDQKVTIKIDARELYPVKQFNSTFAYQVKYYLPNTTYYSIIDTITKEPIIDYSENTKVVRDNYNNLIKLNFSNWAVGRTYTLLLKVVSTDNEEIFEIGTFDIYE